MACALTQGYTLACSDNMGGVKEFYIIEHANITSFTQAAGEVTALVKESGKQFYKYEQEQNVAEVDEAIEVNQENGTRFANSTIKLVINKRQVSVRNEIMLLAKNKVVIVEVDRNGTAWIHGLEFGLRLGASNAKSGRAGGDRNGYELSFAGQEREMAYELDATVLTALTTPGS